MLLNEREAHAANTYYGENVQYYNVKGQEIGCAWFCLDSALREHCIGTAKCQRLLTFAAAGTASTSAEAIAIAIAITRLYCLLVLHSFDVYTVAVFFFVLCSPFGAFLLSR